VSMHVNCENKSCVDCVGCTAGVFCVSLFCIACGYSVSCVEVRGDALRQSIIILSLNRIEFILELVS